MLGTSPEGKGGIATVVRGYRAQDLLDEEKVRYLTTHRDTGPFGKLLAMLTAIPVFWMSVLTGRVGVVHAHVSFGPSFWRKWFLLLPAYWRGVPVLCHIHAGTFKEYFNSGSSLRKTAIRYMFRRAFRVIVLTEAWRKWVLEVEPASKPEIIPNSLDERFGLDLMDAVRVGNDILFLGRIGPGKGTFDLLAAFATVKKQIADARLICGGDGDSAGLMEKARALGVDASVVYAGWVGAEKKETLLRQAAVLALPSYREGLPVVILEAMAFSLPVVSCPVGGIPQVVVEGETGYLVEPGDVHALAETLIRLLGDGELRARMGRRGRQVFDEHFSHRANLPKLRRLYRLAAG